MKILLTGATGFLGYRTLEKLVHLPEVTQIVATGRTIKKSHCVNHPKVKYVLGDLTDVSFVETVMQDIKYVIHAAALSSPWGSYSEFYQANVQIQKNLIAASQKNDVTRFVFVSTPSLYFDFNDRLNIKESDPLPTKFVNAYAETKRLAEIELEKANIPYVILRPRALTGRGDTVIMPRLIKAYDDGRIKIIGTGKNVVDLTAVANVVDAIILGLLATGKSLNETYNITNGTPVNLWDKIDFILTKLGRGLPQKKVSYWLVYKVASLMEFKSKMTNKKEPSLTKYGVGILAKTFTMDISKARKLLNYSPKVTTEQAINEFVNWYKENEKG